MVTLFFEQAVAILLLVQNGCTIPVVEVDKSYKYEEYVIEHEISSTQAKNSVLSTNVNSSKCKLWIEIILVPNIFCTLGEINVNISLKVNLPCA